MCCPIENESNYGIKELPNLEEIAPKLNAQQLVMKDIRKNIEMNKEGGKKDYVPKTFHYKIFKLTDPKIPSKDKSMEKSEDVGKEKSNLKQGSLQLEFGYPQGILAQLPPRQHDGLSLGSNATLSKTRVQRGDSTLREPNTQVEGQEKESPKVNLELKPDQVIESINKMQYFLTSIIKNNEAALDCSGLEGVSQAESTVSTFDKKAEKVVDQEMEPVGIVGCLDGVQTPENIVTSKPLPSCPKRRGRKKGTVIIINGDSIMLWKNKRKKTSIILPSPSTKRLECEGASPKFFELFKKDKEAPSNPAPNEH